ncbi:MAG: transporter [Ilumatobacter coccineus]|uniref:Transporter n=1 Tax=Ilumatobacter coccineus TaxID=467094 RepID=A0A2G6KBF9_9ACTN|nr:MAG: transporter [Ilumatobacter coccineus]
MLTFTVPDMTCDHCVAAISTEVTAVAGVTSVTCDLTTKVVTVDGEGLDRAALVAAIDEAGFDVA